MSLKEQVRETERHVVNAIKSVGERTADTDILATLKTEHNEVKKLLKELHEADIAAERSALVRQITAALVPHSVAEEKVVYQAVIAFTDAQAQMDGYEGTLEHKWAAKTLERLGAIADATSAEHLATAKVLKELVEHHIKEEEQNIWRDVRKHCSSDERARMNALYLAEKHRVRVPSAD
jgi:hemerythrin superfamily protein